MRVKCRLLPVLLFCTVTATLFSQDSLLQGDFLPLKNSLIIYAAKATGNIKTDGRLNEPDWQKAAPFTDFIQADTNHGLPSKYQTAIKILKAQ